MSDKHYEDVNVATVSGHVTKEPYINAPETFAAFSLGTYVRVREDDEYVVKRVFRDVKIVGGLAKLASYLKPGSSIILTGRDIPEVDEYESNGETVKRHKVTLYADKLVFQSGGKGDGGKSEDEIPHSSGSDEDIPF